MSVIRFEVQYRDEGSRLHAFEPTATEVETAASRLSEYYNDPYNRSMLTNSAIMSARDIEDHYREARERGDRLFLLERDGDLVGDADFRHFDLRSAEFAILIGARDQQGRGLGGKFAVMLHALAFREWKLARVYVGIIPANQPSISMFKRLGYEVDVSPRARDLAEDATDVTLSIDAAGFAEQHAAMAGAVTISPKSALSDMSGR